MKSEETASHSSTSRARLEHQAEAGMSGAVAGAVVGAAAGPPGAAVGAVLGGVAGTLVAAALEQQHVADAERTRELDKEIGVTEGELGAPNLQHPPASVGAYSTASVGVGSMEPTPAEGPIEAPKP